MIDFSIARKNGSGAIVWSEDQIRYIINEYVEKDRTLKSLAADFKVQPQAIRNLLRKNNITITNKKTRDYPRKSDYFSIIDSHEKAYWIGVLLSDGSVSKKNTISLSLKDKEHVEKFRKALGAVNKITTVIDNRFSKSCYMYYFTIRDSQLFNDLSKYYIVPNKTYTNFGMPNIDPEYLWDFVRGYFDGDGSLYFTDNKFKISFVGNNNFLTDLKNFMGKDNLALSKSNHSITYELKICGQTDVNKILTNMYKDSTEDTRLNRKYDLAQMILSKAHHS